MSSAAALLSSGKNSATTAPASSDDSSNAPRASPSLAALSSASCPPGLDLPVTRTAKQPIAASTSWQDVERIRKRWQGRLIVKGILNEQVAARAVNEGVDAIVVSNHGGRNLDHAVPSIAVLPDIAQAVGGRIPILLDSGIRRGSDIAKALALGATAVLVGRPTLYGLAAGGEEGASRALSILRDELDRVLAMLGTRAAQDLSPEFILRT